jgi:hypothetical protein
LAKNHWGFEIMETIEFTLPARWAHVLINGDFQGCSQEDLDAMNFFIEKEKVGSCLGCSREQFFSWSNDSSLSEGCDCLIFTFVAP